MAVSLRSSYTESSNSGKIIKVKQWLFYLVII